MDLCKLLIPSTHRNNWKLTVCITVACIWCTESAKSLKRWGCGTQAWAGSVETGWPPPALQIQHLLSLHMMSVAGVCRQQLHIPQDNMQGKLQCSAHSAWAQLVFLRCNFCSQQSVTTSHHITVLNRHTKHLADAWTATTSAEYCHLSQHCRLLRMQITYDGPVTTHMTTLDRAAATCMICSGRLPWESLSLSSNDLPFTTLLRAERTSSTLKAEREFDCWDSCSAAKSAAWVTSESVLDTWTTYNYI